VTTDINATDFLDRFSCERATVGIVGHGFVGKAIDEFFKSKMKVLVNDKVKPELNTLREVVEGSEVIFVAVPSPMQKDGSCYTGFLKEVISSIKDEATALQRNHDSFVIVVKSTVYPGFVDEMKKLHPTLRITFSPEFLTEANSVQDFKKTNRIIVGGDERDALVVCKYFYEADPLPVEKGARGIFYTSSTVAETVKLYANGILATKVIFSNEMYQICQKLGINYEEVRELAVLDTRIGAGHTKVPGPDGHLGFSGSCFPKDINNLKNIAKKLGVEEKIFTAVIERNEALRPEKDWEQLKGRAVLDE
jgi:nucleotide sugar dehydrogenase